MAKIKHKSIHQSNRGIINLFNMMNLTLPKAFQLPKLDDVASLNSLKDRFNDLDARITRLKTTIHMPPQSASVPPIDEKIVASIATNAWRASVKMVDPDTKEPKAEMKRVYRHIESIIEALKQIKVQIVDPTGGSYDSGMALKVVSFEQTPGLSKEEIKETVKPTIVWQNHRIQIGEVIVGTPLQITDSERGTKDE